MEKADNDLDILAHKVWRDEDLQSKNLEYFSDEKITFFCFKAMKALQYLRS
jgi:hypothetical protein